MVADIGDLDARCHGKVNAQSSRDGEVLGSRKLEKGMTGSFQKDFWKWVEGVRRPFKKELAKW